MIEIPSDIANFSVYMTHASLHRCMFILDHKYKTSVFRFIPLGEYLEAADHYGWDLSRDVNYIYVTRKYPSRDLKRRVTRVISRFFDEHIPFRLCCGFLHDVLFLNWTGRLNVREAMNYNPKSDLFVFAKVLLWVRRRELDYGFDDPLDLED